jgi:hypothetical protein
MPSKSWGCWGSPFCGDASTTFHASNQHKQSVMLDFNSADELA